MIAGLPMYDLPEIRTETDTLWQAIAAALSRRGLAGAPAQLTRDRDEMALWTAPDLLLAQTCGYPLTHALAGRVQLVATPCYAAPGCDGPLYTSLLVAREDEGASLEAMRGTRAAYNMVTSQSGYAALRAAVAPLARDGRFFGGLVETGSHAASIDAVRDRLADICAVDAVTHALLARYRPHALAGLKVVGRTPSAPGLPLVTAEHRDDDEITLLREALADIVADPDLAGVRRALLLADFAVRPPDEYRSILDMERQCRTRGYPDLA
jgi:ABC-type phosphate/phosphonate transport system substrate-binding protein